MGDARLWFQALLLTNNREAPRYDMNLFDEAAKRAHRDSQFPIDLANARALGKRLVEKAMTHI